MPAPRTIVSHRPGRRTLPAACWLVIAAVACTSCSGRPRTVPAPTKAEAIARVREFFDSQKQIIVANPASASRTIEPVVEMLEPLAAHYGPPFVEFVDTVKQVRSSWGSSPAPATVQKDVGGLAEKAAALAP